MSGKGNSYTAELWQYDSRLGRRWNIDPVDKPWESSYLTFGGNPILYSDVLGNDIDENASGYNEAKRAATPILNKDGSINMKKSVKNGYEPEFAIIFNEFKNNTNIMVKFEYLGDEAKEGGTISCKKHIA